MHSRRVAFHNSNGEELCLRTSIECSSKKCQNELGLEPPFSWNYAVLTFDNDKNKWTELKSTFTDFKEADNYFKEKTNQMSQEISADNLHAGCSVGNPRSEKIFSKE